MSLRAPLEAATAQREQSLEVDHSISPDSRVPHDGKPTIGRVELEPLAGDVPANPDPGDHSPERTVFLDELAGEETTCGLSYDVGSARAFLCPILIGSAARASLVVPRHHDVCVTESAGLRSLRCDIGGSHRVLHTMLPSFVGRACGAPGACRRSCSEILAPC